MLCEIGNQFEIGNETKLSDRVQMWHFWHFHVSQTVN